METTRNETNYRLSKRLKAVVIVLAVLGGLLTAGVVFFRLIAPGVFGATITTFSYGMQGGSVEYTKNPTLVQGLVGYSVFTLFASAMCYKILWHFWHVCTEIGRDNSFSPENHKSFHRMAVTSYVIAGSYVVKFMYIGGRMLWAHGGVVEIVAVCGLIFCGVILFFLFGVICEALSKLIKNAYEIKAENDLTI